MDNNQIPQKHPFFDVKYGKLAIASIIFIAVMKLIYLIVVFLYLVTVILIVIRGVIPDQIGAYQRTYEMSTSELHISDWQRDDYDTVSNKMYR
jgi:hypothetical protein